jgi:predicted alpha/beta hydrolase family esterase
MKNTLAGVLLVTGALSATTSIAHASDKPMKVAGVQFVPTPDVKWSDVPGMTGVQIAAVDGDPSKGPDISCGCDLVKAKGRFFRLCSDEPLRRGAGN